MDRKEKKATTLEEEKTEIRKEGEKKGRKRDKGREVVFKNCHPITLGTK